jgi:hypothetical protein
MILCKKDDEDKGSSFHSEANPALQVRRFLETSLTWRAGKNRKFSGSPPGVPSPVHLSLQVQLYTQHRTGNHADKNIENGKF